MLLAILPTFCISACLHENAFVLPNHQGDHLGPYTGVMYLRCDRLRPPVRVDYEMQAQLTCEFSCVRRIRKRFTGGEQTQLLLLFSEFDSFKATAAFFDEDIPGQNELDPPAFSNSLHGAGID